MRMRTYLSFVALQLLLFTITRGTKLSFLDHTQFQRESCFLQLHDNITWYDADTSLLLSNGHISKLNRCQISAKESVGNEVQIIGQVSSDQILMCRSQNLYQTDASLSKTSLLVQDSEFYKSKSLCISGGELTATLISNNLYAFSNVDGTAKISKYSPQTGNFVKSEGFKVSDDPNAVSLIFNHGNFVYRIYTGESGEARVARVCENDQGNYGSFSTERYGGLSCTVAETDHTILLDAQYDTANSQLLLLTSRTPVDLSGRVLCAFSIEGIDNKLDTGRFLDYDEMGRERGTKGSKMNCIQEDQMNYLTQLLDLIEGSRILLTHQRNYHSFKMKDSVWYLATDDAELDVWREKRDGTLTRIQSVQTNMSPSRLLLSSSSGDITLLSRHKIALLPKFFCSHFQEPAECYQGPSCSWSEENWNCSLSSEKRTLAEDYPRGVVSEVSKMGGCVTEITTYTEHDTRVTRNTLSCPMPKLAPNVELVSQNATCLGHLTTQCRSGSDHTSGDLVRQCLPTGNWSGAMPICTERRCPALVPSPGSRISSEETAVGTTLHTFCTDPCHVPSHQFSLRCLETGQWNGSLPTCSPATCKRLSLPDVNTVLLYEERHPKCGGQFAVRCAAGTDLVYGDLVRTCQRDGSWSGQDPLCTVTHCPVFPSPRNGYLSTPARGVGSLVTITCNSCYKVSGMPGLTHAASALCLSSGRWSINPPSCQRVTCPPLIPATGVNMLSLNTSCFGVAEFQCSTGFTLHSGSKVRFCQLDGKWSGSAPLCVPETCPPLQFSREDRVVVLRRGERYGERSEFRCHEGSTLLSGQLELLCLPGGVWSGEKPRCVASRSTKPAPAPVLPTASIGTEAPEPVSSIEEENPNIWKIVAIVGWAMCTICLIFIFLVFVFLKGRNNSFHSGHCNGKSSLERQVTTSTTLGVGTLDLRKSRTFDPDAVTPTYSTNTHIVTPVTPTYHIYDRALSTLERAGSGVT